MTCPDRPPPSCSRPSGGGFGCQSGKLANLTCCQQLGITGGSVGIQASVGSSKAPSLSFSSGFQASSVDRGARGSRRRGSGFKGKRCDRGGKTSPFTGFLRAALCCPQGKRRLAPCSGFVPSQSISQADPLQNGNPLLSERISASGRLGYVYRPYRRLFSHTHSPSPQEMAAFQMASPGLPVSRSAIRPVPQPLGFYQDSQGIGHRGESPRNPTLSLPRRLVGKGAVGRRLSPAHEHRVVAGHELGVFNQSEQVRVGAFPMLCVPGYALRHERVVGAPGRQEAGQVGGLSVGSQPRDDNFRQASCFGSRSFRVHGAHRPSCGGLEEASPEMARERVVPVSGPLGQETRVVNPVLGCSADLVRPEVVGARRSDFSSNASGGGIYGRFSGGMGSSFRRSHSTWNMVSGADDVAHQPSGVGGGLPRPSSFYSLDGEGSDSGSIGQCYRGCIHKSSRRNSFTVPVSQSGKSVGLAGRTRLLPVGQACQGDRERVSGPTQSAAGSDQHGMDSGALRPTASLGSLVQTDDRSVCDTIQQEASDFRVTGARRSSLGGGCTLYSLVESASLCLSSVFSAAEGATESRVGVSGAHSDSSTVAGSVLVSGSSETLRRAVSSPTSRAARSSSASVGRSSRQSRRTESSRVEVVRRAMRGSGASRDALSLLEEAHRPSTKGVYASHWRRWVSWCHSHAVDPCAPSEVDIANHLAKLATSLGLSASSLRVRRASIRTTLAQLGFVPRGSARVVSDVIKGAALKQARCPRRVPAWDLFLVLAYLRGSPFEPLRYCSLHDLTLKTVFLVTLASGRRCSEIHGLSGLEADIAFERNGSISLRFLPEFLAKNQVPGDPSPVVLIKPLTQFVDPEDPDVQNCPVRVLREYIRRTKRMRSVRKRRLFVSLNPNYAQDIAKPTLARWVATVVRRAYADFASSGRGNRGGAAVIPLSAAKPHEVRAWAASLARQHSTNLSDVLEAAYWRSEDVFISFYLRDTHRSRADGRCGVGSAVVAQHIMSSATSH